MSIYGLLGSLSSLGMILECFFGLGIQCLVLLESQWHIHDSHQPKQVSWLAKPQANKKSQESFRLRSISTLDFLS